MNKQVQFARPNYDETKKSQPYHHQFSQTFVMLMILTEVE